jgi:phosphoribosylanthranilate isomerase
MTLRIKICGITSSEDGLAAVEAGADAIGLNFYEKSVRFVRPHEGQEISRATGSGILRVGVFVNHSLADIQRIDRLVKLDGFQVHGDESPEEFARIAAAYFKTDERTAQLASRVVHGLASEPRTISKMMAGHIRPRVIRARRLDSQGVSAIAEDLRACHAAGGIVGAILIDALTPGRYGGTGETISWPGLADHRRWLQEIPLILAGGLTPDNVAEAIRIVRPQAVDVASGVESSPGKKDHAKVRDFVAAAREAFAS